MLLKMILLVQCIAVMTAPLSARVHQICMLLRATSGAAAIGGAWQQCT